ncbi:MAG: hypothetical protein Q9220_006395 [cf. Caloplaca sp. 1 TL-2023]
MSRCCVSGFKWNRSPEGRESKLGELDTYIAGSDTQKDAAIMIISDAFGWTLINTRLLATHFAYEANVTVYLPDLYVQVPATSPMVCVNITVAKRIFSHSCSFDGDLVPAEVMDDPKTRDEYVAKELGPWVARNSKENRAAAIHDAARALKQDLKFKKVGVMGYCWGGWGAFQLGAKDKGLVDCISAAHPSLLTKEEIDELAVPVQILAPEHDTSFTPELKEYANKTIPALGLQYDYQYFPGLSHGFGTRGDPNDEVQRRGLERAKNAASAWFGTHLH